MWTARSGADGSRGDSGGQGYSLSSVLMAPGDKLSPAEAGGESSGTSRQSPCHLSQQQMELRGLHEGRGGNSKAAGALIVQKQRSGTVGDSSANDGGGSLPLSVAQAAADALSQHLIQKHGGRDK